MALLRSTKLDFTQDVARYDKFQKALRDAGMWMRLRVPSEAGYWQGTHEPDVQNAIICAVQPGMVVYDIGAHLGSFALGTARLVSKLGRVVAFDGDPENVSRLRENVRRNELAEDRLRVVHSAVWSSTRSEGI